MRPPVLISPQSKISLPCIGCVECRACTASRGLRRRHRLRTENLKTCSLRCAGRRFPVTPIGCPAIEQFGEGIFIHFDEVAIGQWLGSNATKARHDRMVGGYLHWIKRFAGEPPDYPGTAYVLLHSLSHSLMAEIALDCGYPASSLKERIYVLSGATGGAPDRCGILIYTATAGAQGTLGGLVGTAPRFAIILRSALARATICSNDPVYADHEPDDRSGDRATHGAACHGCLLIAETSCEMRNLFLDRNLLVPTMATGGAPFF
jgi:MrfA Zn-binding domain